MRRLLITCGLIAAVLIALVVFASQPGKPSRAKAQATAFAKANVAYSAHVLAQYKGAPAPAAAVADVTSVLSLPKAGQLPVVGVPLTSTLGYWRNPPSSYSFEWFRCGAVSCAHPKAVSTRRTYIPTLLDVGQILYVKVTAHNKMGSTSQNSVQSGVVSAPAPVRIGIRSVAPVASGYVGIPLLMNTAGYSTLAPGMPRTVARIGSKLSLAVLRGPALIYELRDGSHTVWHYGPIDDGWNTFLIHVVWGAKGYVELWLDGSPGVGMPSVGMAGTSTRAYLNTGSAAPVRMVSAAHATLKAGETLASVQPADIPQGP